MAQSLAPERVDRSRGALVEFIGLPGSGKSTIAHALADLLRERGESVSEPTWRNDHATRRPLRALRKATLALAAAARDGAHARALVEWVASSRQPTRGETLRLAINALYVAETTERCARSQGVHIFDQGLLQQLWSLLYRATHNEDLERRCAEQLAMCGARLHVVIVEAPLGVLQRRLEARTQGASRLERQLRNSEPHAALQRAMFAQRRVDEVADALSSCHAIRLLRVSGAGDLTVRQAARAVGDWLN